MNGDTPDALRRGTSTPNGSRDDVSLYEYFEQRLAAVDARLLAMIDFQRELTHARFDAAQAAITKADTATEKRFESVNEFRGQLADQTRTFASREALEASAKEGATARDGLAAATAANTARLSNLEGRLVAYSGAVGLGVTFISIIVGVLLHFWK